MQQWMIYTKRADFQALGEKYQISPVLARIMINRGVREADFASYLHGTAGDMHPPELLPDAAAAVSLILQAIADGKKIRVVGDYDVDGICATYLLLTGLKRLGADVSYDIPHRMTDGYGINRRIIDEAHKAGVGMIVTCDNGISAVDAVSYAKQLGMTVIVTDHHEPPELLPDADAIVNPKRADSQYPFPEICGGMVAYKLLGLLYQKTGIAQEEWFSLLPYAAIATVADVMPLADENRLAVKEGLRRIPYTENKGLQKLMAVCGLNPYALTSYSIGFVIGPCMNACGRLEYAGTAVELLLTEDDAEAERIAGHLKQLNDDRKDMTERFAGTAIQLAETEYANDAVKVLYLPECHEAIAGIIAGRVKEYCHHPAIIFTDSESGLLKGSARSIDSYNIFEKLTEAQDLLDRYGGHKLAAGLSIRRENLDAFRDFLNAHAGLTQEDFIEKVWIDVALPFGVLNEELIGQLSLLEPFGQGNEKPLFAQKAVKLLSARAMGAQHNVAKLYLRDTDGNNKDAVWFGDADSFLSGLAQKQEMDILYYPQVNEYQGRRTVQLVLKGWKPVSC